MTLSHITLDGGTDDTPIGNVADALKAVDTAGNAILTSIDTKTPALGQQLAASSTPVVLTAAQMSTLTPLSVVGVTQSTSPWVVSGSVTSSPGDNTRSTYSASASGFVPAASATDIFCIKGSATKTVKITSIAVSGTTTAGSGFSASTTLVKRSTIDTGGTSVTDTAVPHDSGDMAATAVVTHYTANPTLGNAVGNLRAHRLSIGTAGGAGNVGPLNQWDFGVRASKPIILRGVSEQLCINLGGITITGPIFSASVEWVEE